MTNANTAVETLANLLRSTTVRVDVHHTPSEWFDPTTFLLAMAIAYIIIDVIRGTGCK